MQQAIVLSLLAAAVAWCALTWSRSPAIAWAGFALIPVLYSGGLAFEFLALRRVNRTDPVPQADGLMLARAWLAETMQAPRVFGWRQPFRSGAIADSLEHDVGIDRRRGVVFIHGFVCNRGFWTPWLQRVKAARHPFVAVNLEPVFGAIDEYVPIIERAVAAVAQAGGLPPILICHSMGGLAARAWLRSGENARRVHHVVTIGAPHHGTWLGQFSRLPNGSQMARNSQWLRELDRDHARQAQPPFTCWYSNCDNVVFPSSTATLPGAENHLVAGAAHVDLAFHPRVMAVTLSLLDRL